MDPITGEGARQIRPAASPALRQRSLLRNLPTAMDPFIAKIGWDRLFADLTHSTFGGVGEFPAERAEVGRKVDTAGRPDAK